MRPEDLPEPWCDATCPRQATRMWRDCECGGARREFEHYRDERFRFGLRGGGRR